MDNKLACTKVVAIVIGYCFVLQTTFTEKLS